MRLLVARAAASNLSEVGDILKLPPRRESEVAIRVCACGCVSFMVRSDDVLECTSCQEIYPEHGGRWRQAFQEIPGSLEDGAGSCDVILPGKLALHRLIKQITTMSDKIACVAVIPHNGPVKVWSPILSKDHQKSWLCERLKVIYELVTKERANG